MRRDRRFAAVLVSGLSVFALAVHGYHPYAEDGGVYLSGVKRLLEPSLYPHDTEFVTQHLRFSLFAPTVAGLARTVGAICGMSAARSLPGVLFALHMASVWATLFAAWMLAERCSTTRAARAGAVALLACWLDLPVAGTSLLLMDPYVTARSFSTPCMMLALAWALDWTGLRERRAWRALGLCCTALAAAAMLHPLMAGYALGCVLVLGCLRAPERVVRVWGTAGLCAAAIAAAAAVNWASPPESAAYVRVMMTRSYWFVSQWHWYEVFGLAAPLGILVWATFAGGARRALAGMGVVAGATAWAIAELFARVHTPTHLVARLQPLRMFQVVYMLMALVLGAELGERLLRRSAWRWAVALGLLGGTMLVAARGTYPDSNPWELPWGTPRNPWVQAFLWVRGNTPRDALVALDSDYITRVGEDAQGFRAIAERSAVPDYSKDGGVASIAPALTETWVTGQAASAGLSGETDAERMAALQPLGVSWVVLGAGAKTALACPYGNAAVRVCRLP